MNTSIERHLKLGERQLAAAANRLVSRFIDREPPFDIFMELNETLLKATGSEYGFVARVFKNDKGPFIKTLALTNIAWNEETRKLYAENAQRGMVFDNLDTLFGQVLKTGKTYISNDVANDPNSTGIPEGHPPMDRFLGIPVCRNDIMIGMIGLANGTNYSNRSVEELQELLGVTADIIYGTGIREELIPDGNFFLQPQAIINSFRSAVLSVDTKGQVISANPSACGIFGYQPGAIQKLSIHSLIPPTGDDQLYDSNSGFLPAPEMLGQTIEATGIHRHGSYFPIEAIIDRVKTTPESSYSFVIRDLSEEKKTQSLKNEFISVISHELRTPLTAAHTAISMLADERHRPKDEQLVNHLTQLAKRNCQRLVELVDEILDYEKLSGGKVEFDFEPVSVKTIFDMAQEVTQILADSKDVRLGFEDPDSKMKVAADANRISQVLINMISNAIRASEAGQRLSIGMQFKEGHPTLTIFVQDNGAGIAGENLRSIFEPFTQFNKSAGTAGLGLAICKRIVENHDSRIVCESELGKGTRFSFDLYHDVVLAPALDLSRSSEADQVLWVESDSHQFQLAASGLRRDLFELHHVSNGALAKAFLNKSAIDLLVIGYPVSLQSTESLIRQVRSCPILENVPIVVYGNQIPQSTELLLEEFLVDRSNNASWNWHRLHRKIESLVGS